MTADGPLVVGLDVGTSSVKAAVFGPGGRRGAVATAPVTTGIDGDLVTQDPAGVEAAVFDALGRAVADAPGPVAAVALCTAMHGLVGLDRRDRPVTPYVPWSDGRARGLVEAWQADDAAGWVHRRTGVPLHPMAPLAKLAWFAAHEPHVVDDVARWCDLKGFVVRALCGSVVTDRSSVSGWGLADVRNGAWLPEALALAGTDPDHLPTVEEPGTTLALTATVARRVGLDPSTPVVLGAADGPLGNVGVGATAPGVAGLSLGTSGAVRVVVDAVPDDFDGLFCYALTADRWVLGGAVSNGGGVARWLGATLYDDASDVAGVMALAEQAPPGSDGLVMLPYLLSERAPLWDAGLAGAYLGLRRHHSRAHLARAAIEGVCLGLRAVVDAVDRSVPVTEVRATGGALVAPVWRASLAAALDRPVSVLHTAEGSALGAAAIGLVALGAATDLDAARDLLDDGAEGDRLTATPEAARAVAASRAALPGLGARVARAAHTLG